MSTEQTPPSVIDAVGGPRGMIESALPALAFVVAYTVSGQQTRTSAIVAVGVALVLTGVRLARRESPQFALTGLLGVAFAAFIADRSGEARNFFLPGLLLNLAYAAAFVVSIAIRRPLVGVIVDRVLGVQGNEAAYVRASWMWAGLFAARLAVQLPLYLADAVAALGVARTAMGLPLFALGLWLTWLMVRPRVA